MSCFNDYFTRNLTSLSPAQQHRLQQQGVAIIGCGGLGGYVIEELARIGIGRLHLFDPDVFSPSNCNRQLNALETTMGQNKAEVAAQRVAAMHPYCQAEFFCTDFREVSHEQGFSVDAVVDCLDDIQARYDLAERCNALNLPLIHGAVNGWVGQVGVQFPGQHLLDRLYPRRGGMESQVPPPSVLSFTVALVASLQAVETVKVLLELTSPLHNGWLYIDLKENDFLFHQL